MIQDIGNKIFKNAFNLKRAPKDSDLVFVFNNRDVYVKGDGDSSPICIPKAKDFDEKSLVYLFEIDDICFYLFNDDPKNINLDGYHFENNKIFRKDYPKDICFAGFTAFHLYDWYSKHKYCGRCGHLLEEKIDERAMICPNCNNVIYPTIAPAIIVGVCDKDRIVVTRYNDRPYRGLALIAGFCEIGESPEQTVQREVFEEVGLKVKNIKYFKSQPWGLDGIILIGFTAQLDGSDKITRDTKELSEALWVNRDDIPEQTSTISLTKEMLDAFRKREI